MSCSYDHLSFTLMVLCFISLKLMKGLSAYPGPTLNVTITLDKGIFSEHVLNTLNSPEVKEEFCLHAHRIINKLQLDHSPLPVESSDWIMRSIKPETIAFHVNFCSSTDDIFENKWDPDAPRDFRGDNEALSSWHIYHPYLPRRDSPEKQNTSKKDTKGHILAFIPWTIVLTTLLALIGAWSLFHCLVYMLDITPASVWSMLSLIMEILWIFRKFVVSYLFRPLFLKFFLVLINY